MKKLIGTSVIVSLLFTACTKDDAPVSNPVVTTGVYTLSEGSFGMNNTALSFYQSSNTSVTADIYKIANGSGLGDTGNDLLIYGSKLYVVMNVSSYVEIADAKTAKSLKKLDFKTGTGVKRQPRFIVAYQSKVLVSSYDGTVAVIDTSSLAIDRFITVGANPEQMAVSGNKLYVVNSGGLNPVFDSTMSIVDLNTYTETSKVKVGLNPTSIIADNAGYIFIGCTGNYATVKPRLVKYSINTNTIIKSADTAVGKMRFYNGQLFATGGYLGSSKVRVLNTTDFAQVRANFVTDGTVIVTPYALNIDENGDVYVGDAKDYVSPGEVFCFDQNGKKKFSFSVSPANNPNSIGFLRQ